MSTVALFALSIAALVSIWSGRYEYVIAAAAIFVAAVITDLMGMLAVALQRHYALRNMEVVFHGLAEGSAPEGVRDQIWAGARQAWEQGQRARNSGKAD